MFEKSFQPSKHDLQRLYEPSTKPRNVCLLTLLAGDLDAGLLAGLGEGRSSLGGSGEESSVGASGAEASTPGEAHGGAGDEGHIAEF